MPRPDPTPDPNAVRAARVRKGLTQHELARLVGVAGGERVSRWELGTSAPRPEVLVRLASVLQVSPVELLTPDPRPPDLRRLRVLAGLSARQLASRAHLSLANIQRWESGRIERIPAAPTLEPLADVLGTSTEEVEQALACSRARHRAKP